MEDLTFVLSVAFSGADLNRALWLALVGSLFCTKNFQPLRMTAIIFLIDRIWPYAGMALAGYDMPEIAASVAYAVETFPRDATIYLLRFGGLFVLCASGYHLRLLIHRGNVSNKKMPVPY
ncbi:hypothetical protein [Parvularcula marina]|uniref:hypothetical protein n=1 Tax=Parvularcula marina TaxID=2292771 RepID=UPI003515484C